MATTTERRVERFHDEWAPEHPVRWSPIGGREADAWLSLADAERRLAHHGYLDARARLVNELPVRTVFAEYRLESGARCPDCHELSIGECPRCDTVGEAVTA